MTLSLLLSLWFVWLLLEFLMIGFLVGKAEVWKCFFYLVSFCVWKGCAIGTRD
jgi:hypothetical protein